MMADNIEHVISYWVMFEKFHSPALAGFAVLSHWLPFLLFSVYFGALADRHDCRRIIQLGQVLFMGVSIAWAVLFYTDTLEMWHAAVLLVVHGIAGVLWSPSAQVLIHDIVGREHIASAVRLSATSRQLGILLGPAVGGGLMLGLGTVAGLLVNVLFYVPLVWWLMKAPYGGEERRAANPPRRGSSITDAWTTLLEISGNRTILSMILLAGASSLLVGNAFQAQMPEFAHDHGSEDADVWYSVMFSANAAGAVVGALLLESLTVLQGGARTAIVCATIWGTVMAVFPFVHSYAGAVTLLVLAGIFSIAFSSMAQALVQILAPPHLRGRVVGLFNTSMLGLRAGSGVTVGALGAVIGVEWSLALSATAVVVVCLALLAADVRSTVTPKSERA